VQAELEDVITSLITKTLEITQAEEIRADILDGLGVTNDAVS